MIIISPLQQLTIISYLLRSGQFSPMSTYSNEYPGTLEALPKECVEYMMDFLGMRDLIVFASTLRHVCEKHGVPVPSIVSSIIKIVTDLHQHKQDKQKVYNMETDFRISEYDSELVAYYRSIGHCAYEGPLPQCPVWATNLGPNERLQSEWRIILAKYLDWRLFCQPVSLFEYPLWKQWEKGELARWHIQAQEYISNRTSASIPTWLKYDRVQDSDDLLFWFANEFAWAPTELGPDIPLQEHIVHSEWCRLLRMLQIQEQIMMVI